MTKCRIEWCNRERVRDALYCREHLTDAWRNRLPEPAWRKWTREHQNAKELTGAA